MNRRENLAFDFRKASSGLIPHRRRCWRGRTTRLPVRIRLGRERPRPKSARPELERYRRKPERSPVPPIRRVHETARRVPPAACQTAFCDPGSRTQPLPPEWQFWRLEQAPAVRSECLQAETAERASLFASSRTSCDGLHLLLLHLHRQRHADAAEPSCRRFVEPRPSTQNVAHPKRSANPARPAAARRQFFLNRFVVVRVNRFEKLISFFERVRLDRLHRLLAIPRTAFRRTKFGDNLAESLKLRKELIEGRRCSGLGRSGHVNQSSEFAVFHVIVGNRCCDRRELKRQSASKLRRNFQQINRR